MLSLSRIAAEQSALNQIALPAPAQVMVSTGSIRMLIITGSIETSTAAGGGGGAAQPAPLEAMPVLVAAQMTSAAASCCGPAAGGGGGKGPTQDAAAPGAGHGIAR